MAKSGVEATPQERAERLSQVRRLMEAEGLDGCVIRGTDRYLNEYVPIGESTRAWLSGFSGSVADLLLTRRAAFIFVDGRYYLQAEQEVSPELFEVVKVPLGTANEQAMYQLAGELAGQGVRKLGYEPDRFSVAEFGAMQRALADHAVELIPVRPSLVERARGPVTGALGPLRAVSLEVCGRSVEQKLDAVREAMAQHDLSTMVLQALDDIAYLSNLRGNEIAFQSTFRAVAVVTRDALVLALPGQQRERGLSLSPAVRLVSEDAWLEAVPTSGRVGFDEGSTTEAVRRAIEARGAVPVQVASPLRSLKASKNPAELKHMIQSFRRADQAIWAAQGWLHRRLDKGVPTTELDLAREMARRFKRGGGVGLSFEVIAAAGPNGAVIHYSDPDGEHPIAPGTLVLLDTGTFYEGGYATDLTRTFLAGRAGVLATDRQKALFTAVLKGSIAGMCARVPEGCKGFQLDAICRGPIWAAGFQYLHGTGHGVGINVHEMPPRVSPIGTSVIEPGQVFSIEPGVYIEGEGGVRIENLVTAVPDPEHAGFLRIVPLTFSPLDKRLIDLRRLDANEKRFLKWFADMGRHELAGVPEPFAL